MGKWNKKFFFLRADCGHVGEYLLLHQLMNAHFRCNYTHFRFLFRFIAAALQAIMCLTRHQCVFLLLLLHFFVALYRLHWAKLCDSLIFPQYMHLIGNVKVYFCFKPTHSGCSTLFLSAYGCLFKYIQIQEEKKINECSNEMKEELFQAFALIRFT